MNGTERSPVRILPHWKTMMTNSPNATTAEAATTDNESPELSDAFKLHFENPVIRSRNGGQKLVFRATWKPIAREVIVKFHRSKKRTELTELEMVAHPLSLAHPNVVETHVVGDPPKVFLVEREVTPLHNDWPLSGMDEAVTLLCHIARALSFLQRKGYIHADIKPENLGLDRNRFILMDFGACKKSDKFNPGTNGDGALRTRAPEVLAGSSPRSYKSDLWSLAASLFRLYTKRFPLFLDGVEAKLNVSTAIKERAKNRALWESDFWTHECWKNVPERLDPLMKRMLERDPDKRIDADGVVRCCEEEFAPYLLEDLPEVPIELASQHQMLPVLRALSNGKAGVGFKKSLERLPLLTHQRHTQWLGELLRLKKDLSVDDREFIEQQLNWLKELLRLKKDLSVDDKEFIEQQLNEVKRP
jgi:serine/threonine protein kinase